MSERTKDIIWYTIAALLFIAAGYFLIQILEPFYYGLGWYKIVDNFSIANITREFDYYPFWQKVTYLGIGFATLILIMQVGIFFMMNSIRKWVKKLFNCDETSIMRK